MNRLRIFYSAIFIAATMAQMASAGTTTIIARDGNSVGAVPFAFGAGGDSGAFAEEWTQTSAYQNVTVDATVFGANGGTVNYWLTDSLNNNKPKQDILASGSVGLPSNPASTQLFTLPTLGAGDYFLILQSSNGDSGWLYGYPSAGALTEDAGVNYVNGYIANSNNSGFVPTDSYGGRNYPVEFSVTADAVAPEPTLFWISGIAFLGLASVRLKSAAKAKF